jgi:hypothetical protein
VMLPGGQFGLALASPAGAPTLGLLRVILRYNRL